LQFRQARLCRRPPVLASGGVALSLDRQAGGFEFVVSSELETTSSGEAKSGGPGLHVVLVAGPVLHTTTASRGAVPRRPSPDRSGRRGNRLRADLVGTSGNVTLLPADERHAGLPSDLRQRRQASADTDAIEESSPRCGIEAVEVIEKIAGGGHAICRTIDYELPHNRAILV
jgi:hypothetical protein